MSIKECLLVTTLVRMERITLRKKQAMILARATTVTVLETLSLVFLLSLWVEIARETKLPKITKSQSRS